MAKVQISPLAQQDMLNIRQYIETELGNPVAARRTVERILKAIRQLEQFPLSGTHTTAQVVRVLYGRRDTIRILLGCSFQPEETEEDIE